MKKRLKLSKKNLNIWVLTDKGDLAMVKIPFKYRKQYIETFVPNQLLPNADDVAIWLGMMNVADKFQIDL